MELRICILVPGKVITGFVNEFITWAKLQDDIVIDNVTIVNNNADTFNEGYFLPGFLARVFYRAILWLETKLLIRSDRYRNLLLQNSLLSDHPLLKIIEIQSKNFITLNQDHAPHLMSNKVDAIINFTNNEISEKIISQSKFGMISIRDSDWGKMSNSLWKISFWAVFKKQESTRFEIIQHYSRDSNPLVNGFIRTQLFFSLNRAAVLEKEFSYLKIILKEFSMGKIFVRINNNFQNSVSENDPGFFTFIRYSFQILKLILKKIVRQFLGLGNRWGVAFANADWPNLGLASGIKLGIRPGHYIADPFVISRSGKNYCFVEEYGYKEHKGWISVYELNEESGSFIGIALIEDFHLSFPYLFEFDGSLYMCPETSNKSEIRIYQCDEFPLKWTLKTVLMKDVNSADTMLFEKLGKWWMFTNIDPVQGGDNCSELSIFYADSPLSNEWVAHSQNPVMIDSGKSRNGGLLRKGERIFRVGQAQGYDVYGKRTSINEILILDEHHYEERCIKIVEPDFFENLGGTHHLFSNNEITVFDFVTVRNKWN